MDTLRPMVRNPAPSILDEVAMRSERENHETPTLVVIIILAPVALFGLITPFGPALLLASVVSPEGISLHIEPGVRVLIALGNMAYYFLLGKYSVKLSYSLAIAVVIIGAAVPNLICFFYFLIIISSGV